MRRLAFVIFVLFAWLAPSSASATATTSGNGAVAPAAAAAANPSSPNVSRTWGSNRPYSSSN